MNYPQPPPPPSGGLLLPWLLTGGHVCRRYLVNRDLFEQPGICQSGSPLGGGDGKLSHSKVSEVAGTMTPALSEAESECPIPSP